LQAKVNVNINATVNNNTPATFTMLCSRLHSIVNVAGVHFGRNPRNGGRPPNDSKDVNIMNFISAASLFVIIV
jgi:hypothetical protein